MVNPLGLFQLRRSEKFHGTHAAMGVFFPPSKESAEWHSGIRILSRTSERTTKATATWNLDVNQGRIKDGGYTWMIPPNKVEQMRYTNKAPFSRLPSTKKVSHFLGCPCLHMNEISSQQKKQKNTEIDWYTPTKLRNGTWNCFPSFGVPIIFRIHSLVFWGVLWKHHWEVNMPPQK